MSKLLMNNIFTVTTPTWKALCSVNTSAKVDLEQVWFIYFSFKCCWSTYLFAIGWPKRSVIGWKIKARQRFYRYARFTHNYMFFSFSTEMPARLKTFMFCKSNESLFLDGTLIQNWLSFTERKWKVKPVSQRIWSPADMVP